MEQVFEVVGQVVAKKNNLRPKKGGGFYYASADDKGYRGEINALTHQFRRQWAGRQPVLHPRIRVTFHCSFFGKDRDNMLTTILDCMKQGGVIEDDNIGKFNELVVINPAVRVAKGEDKTVVEMKWEEAIGELPKAA